jgi:cytochrome bd ubiquinol oxidase subunit I
MTLNTITLSRLQFAFTIGYNIIWPAYSIGIAGFIVLLNALWIRIGRTVYRDLLRFWIRLFALGFVMGVVTGVVLSYEIGANWSGFPRVTGNVTGPLLMYEALTAFFWKAALSDRSVWRSAGWTTRAFVLLLHGGAWDSAQRVLGFGGE